MFTIITTVYGICFTMGIWLVYTRADKWASDVIAESTPIRALHFMAIVYGLMVEDYVTVLGMTCIEIVFDFAVVPFCEHHIKRQVMRSRVASGRL